MVRIGLMALAVASCFLSLANARADENSPSRPNVLFIAIDDLRAELRCYGAEHVHSPAIDQLAATGVMFERAYCQQAVCNPSRASLLTGLRLHTMGLWDLPTHFRQRVPEIVTLPQHFKQHGYFTQGVGKIFHNWRQDEYQGDKPSWSVPAVLHYNTHGADKAQVKGPLPPNLIDVPKCEMREVPDNAYFDGRVAEGAVQALQQLSRKQQPFFLAVGFWKPHAHFNAPKKYWDLYPPKTIKPPAPSQPPQDVPALALHDGREILRDFKQRRQQRPTAADTLALRRGYYAAISYMDTQVGKVLAELRRLKLQDSTIVVLWSDHGYHLGEHGLWAKTSNFELDARVPLILAGPNIPAGKRTKHIVELLDIYPTLVGLCELPSPKHQLAGKKLWTTQAHPQDSFALTQHPRPAYSTKGQLPRAMGYSLRTPQFRYTEWRKFGSRTVLARELYDHNTDPAETKNVIDDDEYKTAVETLATQLQEVLDSQPTYTDKAANP